MSGHLFGVCRDIKAQRNVSFGSLISCKGVHSSVDLLLIPLCCVGVRELCDESFELDLLSSGDMLDMNFKEFTIAQLI